MRRDQDRKPEISSFVFVVAEDSRYSSSFWTRTVRSLSSLLNAQPVSDLKSFISILDSQHRDLVISALGGIGSVFQLQVRSVPLPPSLTSKTQTYSPSLPYFQSPTPRNDFARMFIREGLEDPLSTALFNITSDKDEGAADAKAQILAVFLLFCQVSQADSRVREALGKRRIIRRAYHSFHFVYQFGRSGSVCKLIDLDLLSV
jgi:hypothetical protein